jgi:glycosyltransferase involved in cell wall biosynthesis
MDKRVRVGLLLLASEQWTGGYYYCLNLINCLNYLPDKDKPHLILFYGYKEAQDDFLSVEYPYKTFLRLSKEMNIFERVIDKVYRKFNKRSGFSAYNRNLVSFLYPCHSLDQDLHSLSKSNRVYWIPDFQEKYYPDFFSPEEIRSRDRRAADLSATNDLCVFSSHAALKDYQQFYPGYSNKTAVLNFASVLGNTGNLEVDEVKRKFGIFGDYFISPNQFWIHKNHKILLEACLRLKEIRNDFQVILTGKELDYRFPNYSRDLKNFVKANGMEDNVKFLGFIDRDEQLTLIKHAIAVIQPSLFEGWSTVVEDCKALNCHIILSDIPVHREQCQTNVTFFSPSDPNSLADIMADYSNVRPVNEKFDYETNIRRFASDFLHIATLVK